ncbi:hypothetical protein [Actinacidiphila sp. ITFR-21]|uniref:hypothetical protein n=1 Tax=Actinacidiphila sp. ITFR-21 TaxID=3075199 RepID=UPI00288B2719|nr:hypothetical protein [Streptomyces sp. ITFR-21]WNI16563.1 hypothetical protein RLT57_14285 [Streptomyces sp. ITFR-21]
MERLDRTAAELAAARPETAALVRTRQEAAWQARIEIVLEGLADTERARAADELRAMLGRRVSHRGVSAGASGLAVGRDLHLQADGGSAVAVTMGNVTLEHPRQPGPHQD